MFVKIDNNSKHHFYDNKCCFTKYISCPIASQAAAQSSGCNGGLREQNRECCSKKNPCKEGQGDCDDNFECEGDLVCGRNNCGPHFLWHSADCCERKGRHPEHTHTHNKSCTTYIIGCFYFSITIRIGKERTRYSRFWRSISSICWIGTEMASHNQTFYPTAYQL